MAALPFCYNLSIFLSFYLSIFLSFYLSIFLSFYLSIFLSFYLAPIAASKGWSVACCSNARDAYERVADTHLLAITLPATALPAAISTPVLPTHRCCLSIGVAYPSVLKTRNGAFQLRVNPTDIVYVSEDTCRL
jgi:hypothetical protein